MNSSDLTKIYVSLPNHWAIGGESLNALPVGKNRFEIQNIPFYAYALNYLDVVHAVPDTPGQIPRVLYVSKRSGHRTLRAIFEPHVSSAEQEAHLALLLAQGVLFERINSIHVALDVAPRVSYAAVRKRLAALRAAGILGYETCEVRVSGSFDASPPEASRSGDGA